MTTLVDTRDSLPKKSGLYEAIHEGNRIQTYYCAESRTWEKLNNKPVFMRSWKQTVKPVIKKFVEVSHWFQ